ncbi:uncharacterized protein L3040_000283 [Drepanopeziza brunnea f. sp. 'multigermtubi']|uniref:uncharacterized protein n=1 Tax=Drepanopeziza brunnea f. sp. 'multigermtubi' TaxID=698441 RepID=UPI00238617CC|nr:hypothetical protein L3040_000283 [Drepanopeziza brunnea f. sp. 'multigermtubi']
MDRAAESHTGPRNSIDDTRALLISRQPPEEQAYVEMFAVMLPSSDIDAAGKATFVGSIGIIRLAEDGQSAEVAYGMLPRDWGRGYAPAALEFLVDYYWSSDRKVQKDILSAGTEPRNVQSRRGLEKDGFTRGATIEKAFEARDSVTGEMEWRAARHIVAYREADGIEWGVFAGAALSNLRSSQQPFSSCKSDSCCST